MAHTAANPRSTLERFRARLRLRGKADPSDLVQQMLLGAHPRKLREHLQSDA